MILNSSTRWHAFVFVFCGALGAVAWAHTAPAQTRIPIERPPAEATLPQASEGVICQGGPQNLADIELFPDTVVSRGGRERIEYHAEVHANRGTLGIAWDADVLNDRGQVVVKRLDAGQATKRSGDTAVTRTLSTKLADGFYALRVRAAVAADGEPSDIVEAVQYVEVRGGKWAELTSAEWLSRSRAREGFSETEVKAMGLL